MGRYNPITLPPGSTLFFKTTEPDEFGNYEYLGSYIIVGPSGETLPEPKPPSYASSPVYGVAKTKPTPVEPPGSKVFNEHVRDGVNLRDGGVRKLSTGELVAANNTGWVNSQYVKQSDNIRATDYNPGGDYGNILEASGFDFSSIPDNATITGIKVRVERSKVPGGSLPEPTIGYPNGDIGLMYYRTGVSDLYFARLHKGPGFYVISTDPVAHDAFPETSSDYRAGGEGTEFYLQDFNVAKEMVVFRVSDGSFIRRVTFGTGINVGVGFYTRTHFYCPEWNQKRFRKVPLDDPLNIEIIDVVGPSDTFGSELFPLPGLGDGVIGAINGSNQIDCFSGLDGTYYGYLDIAGAGFSVSKSAPEGIMGQNSGNKMLYFAANQAWAFHVNGYGPGGVVLDATLNSDDLGALLGVPVYGNTNNPFQYTCDGNYAYMVATQADTYGGAYIACLDFDLNLVQGFDDITGEQGTSSHRIGALWS